MEKKPKKRLRLNPEDQVLGVKSRQKRDLLAGCNEPGKEWFHPDDHVFMKAFCRLCKNADCIRAKGAVSPWHTRMAEQVDYLLNNPEFSEISSESHRRLAEQAFNDIGQKMRKLEISRQNQDWEIPEDGPTDGFDKVASPDTTDQFDEAAKKLARARGKKEPDLPRPQGEEAPAHFQTEEDDDPYEYDTDYPSSDGSRTYHVVLDKGGRWTCECAGYKNRKKCKHIETVSQWYREQLERDDEEGSSGEPDVPAPHDTPVSRPKTPSRDPRVPLDPRPFNTPMPQGGVMVGTGDVLPDQGQQRSKVRVKDPWAVTNDKVVKPGAKVTLKSKKNE